ncbi:hypothetical protein, partial [Kushneria phosphatilytica]|uniref:hypothetical protein n=1 Tax=Kushneria phosphatilytica TaxID=657387 RepID=UPI0019819116
SRLKSLLQQPLPLFCPAGDQLMLPGSFRFMPSPKAFSTAAVGAASAAKMSSHINELHRD